MSDRPLHKMSEPSDTVILSVALKSGRFKSELSCPLFGDDSVRDQAVGQWLEMIQFAFASGVQEMRATFDEKPRRAKETAREP